MADAIIERIFDIFERFGASHYGEDASQLAHALQTAELARRNHCSDAMIVAALLHDIGQFLGDAGNAAEKSGVDALHEEAGAQFLRPYFPPEVTEPIRLHVIAKRYLCSVEPGYLIGLTRASALSLRLQGGPMTPDEARAFEANPYFADAVQLRRFDDMGKNPAWRVPDLASHRARLAFVACVG
ncbi:HD domain-containing protein [Sphingomonas sp. CJ20]